MHWCRDISTTFKSFLEGGCKETQVLKYGCNVKKCENEYFTHNLDVSLGRYACIL